MAVAAAALLWLLTAMRCARAELAFGQDFNGPGTTWKILETDISARILSQERVPAGARDGSGAERIVAAAPAGESLMLHCSTARVAVLPELQVRLWVKSDRPAVQLAVRVALPRTLAPQSGAPTTVVVRGDAVSQAGHWQQLRLTDTPKLLAAEVRVLRATPGATIDSREAYVDSVVLVVPGDPRGAEVLTDDLEVDGIALARAEEIELTSYPADHEPSTAARASTSASVQLQGGLLLADDRPFLPRVIEWQGEPLALLAERGFNSVLLKGAPTDEQIAEAQRHGLRFVCAAPRPEAIARDGIGRSGDRILAWYLDDPSLEADPNYAFRWAELVRRHDAVAGRPVVIAPAVDWATAGKTADILAAGHPLLSRMSAEVYDEWLERRPPLARPGTPFWAAFSTQFGPAASQQAAALAGAPRMPPAVELNRLESQVRGGCTRGVRGFIFHSESSLAESDSATRERAAALESINRRLQLLEPWLAGGQVIGRITSSDSAWTGVVLHVDRARLLVPLPAAPLADAGEPNHPATPPSSSGIAFLVPGVPATSQAYALSPAALRTLPAQRVAGGTRIVLSATGEAFLLITEDPKVVESLRQRVARDGSQMIRLQRDLVAQRAALVADTARRLQESGHHGDAALRGVALVSEQLRQIDAQIAAGRLEQAGETANAANRIIVEQAAAERHRVLGTSAAFDSHPLAVSHQQLADYAAFQRSYAALLSGENLLYGGDFEDLGQTTQFGWRHVQHPRAGIETHVELSATQPKHGQYCLALHAAAGGTSQEAAIVEGPCVWIVSPPMPVDEGQIIEITGWVRIDEPLGGDGEGLQIVDSLGGPELSLAIRRTTGWQPFRMLRGVPKSTELRLTFALAGLGSARVDAVMVRALSQAAPRRLPPASPTDAPQEGNMAEQPTRLRSLPRPR